MLFGSLVVLNEISTEAQLYLERQNIHQSFYVTHKTQPGKTTGLAVSAN